MVKENGCLVMEISMKGFLRIICLMELGNLNGKMGKFILDNGKETSFMGKGCLIGPMAGNIKDILSMVRNLDLESFFGVMEGNIKETGLKGKCMEKGFILLWRKWEL